MNSTIALTTPPVALQLHVKFEGDELKGQFAVFVQDMTDRFGQHDNMWEGRWGLFARMTWDDVEEVFSGGRWQAEIGDPVLSVMITVTEPEDAITFKLAMGQYKTHNMGSR